MKIVPHVATWLSPRRLLAVQIALTIMFGGLLIGVTLSNAAAFGVAFVHLVKSIVETWRMRWPKEEA